MKKFLLYMVLIMLGLALVFGEETTEAPDEETTGGGGDGGGATDEPAPATTASPGTSAAPAPDTTAAPPAPDTTTAGSDPTQEIINKLKAKLGYGDKGKVAIGSKTFDDYYNQELMKILSGMSAQDLANLEKSL